MSGQILPTTRYDATSPVHPYAIQSKLARATALVLACTGDSMAGSLDIPLSRLLNTRRFGVTGYALRSLVWTVGGAATQTHTDQATFISGSTATLAAAADEIAFSSPMGGTGVAANNRKYRAERK